MKPIRLVAHARTVLAQREIEAAWVERAVRQPDWTEPDIHDSAAERRFLPLLERNGRVLRVVCVETDIEIRVITVFLDRKARKPV